MNDILLFPIISATEKDELGQTEETVTFDRQVFCQKKSIPQNEFFQAGQSGIKSSFIFIVNTHDYQDEGNLQYKGKTYHVYRTYERPDETIELYVEVRLNG
ncbi:phage head closure protein [Arthrobacter citreus]|nr:phage head closure protein [Arthrobacter citreus]